MNEKTPNVIHKELSVATGEKPSCGVWSIQRLFLLPLRKGPLETLPKGALVELCNETAGELFARGCVLPHEPKIPAVGKYKLLHRQRLVIDGLYTDLLAGECIELSDTEALPYLRQRLIELVNEKQEVK